MMARCNLVSASFCLSLVFFALLARASTFSFGDVGNVFGSYDPQIQLGSNLTDFPEGSAPQLVKRQLTCDAGYGYCSSEFLTYAYTVLFANAHTRQRWLLSHYWKVLRKYMRSSWFSVLPGRWILRDRSQVLYFRLRTCERSMLPGL